LIDPALPVAGSNSRSR